MIATSGKEQQKKKGMAELFSEVVTRNGNDKGNGKKNYYRHLISPFLIGSNPPALRCFDIVFQRPY